MAKRRHNGFFSLGQTRWRAGLAVCLAVCLTIASGGCFSSDEGETYYGRVNVPARQEFRWSDGGLPQIFDPALAAAPPDTDVVRAMFEGLTEYDPKTLTPVSGVAVRWESSAEDREWTFHLRHDARWSNGERVTAHDFVRSWQRTLELGDRAPHAKLLANLEGAQ
ncbi:MAG TPA: ABC transporter substrate-binding protein, partial [Pyrinomonadaceae bacterium]|nr:ABC transporter substrate-binding protein [Pyrinomonadaceae bacterium]